MKNDSACDVVNYHLGFDGSIPEVSNDSNADFGGENHPSFTIHPGEIKVIEATMVAAPEDVGTLFQVYYDFFTSNGTQLNDLPLGGLYAEFTITAPPVQPTTLLSPNNNASIDTTSPTLDWKSVSGATVYRVVLSDNSSFSGLSNDGRSCSNNTCQTDTTNSTSYPVGTDLTVEFGKTYPNFVRTIINTFLTT